MLTFKSFFKGLGPEYMKLHFLIYFVYSCKIPEVSTSVRGGQLGESLPSHNPNQLPHNLGFWLIKTFLFDKMLMEYGPIKVFLSFFSLDYCLLLINPLMAFNCIFILFLFSALNIVLLTDYKVSK